MKKKEAEFLTPEEVALLLSMPDKRTLQGKRDYAILRLMVTTGLRKAEVCSLHAKDLKTYRNQWVIDVIGKGNRHRRLVFDSETLRALQDYWKAGIHDMNEDAPLFMTLGKHGPYSPIPLSRKAIDCVIKKYITKACIRKRITPHSLRHTCLTNMLWSGSDSKTVQMIAGHSSLRTTESVYLHTSDEKKVAAVNKLPWVLNPPKQVAKLPHKKTMNLQLIRAG